MLTCMVSGQCGNISFIRLCTIPRFVISMEYFRVLIACFSELKIDRLCFTSLAFVYPNLAAVVYTRTIFNRLLKQAQRQIQYILLIEGFGFWWRVCCVHTKIDGGALNVQQLAHSFASKAKTKSKILSTSSHKQPVDRPFSDTIKSARGHL